MIISADRIGEILREIWLLTVSRTIGLSNGAPTPGGDWLVGCVQITGRWRGSVRIACPPQLVDRVAAMFYSISEPAVSAQQRSDAIGELVNMIGGNLKALLPPPCYLTLPVVSNWSSFALLGEDRMGLVQVGFEDEGYPLVVEVTATQVTPPGKCRTPERPFGVSAHNDFQASGRFPRPRV
jgi:chemotaxis protein CheX